MNQRTDAYGGSLDNRCRFALEVFGRSARRSAPDYIVGIRMTGDEMCEDGRDPDECVEIAAPLAAQRADRLLQRGRRGRSAPMLGVAYS